MGSRAGQGAEPWASQRSRPGPSLCFCPLPSRFSKRLRDKLPSFLARARGATATKMMLFLRSPRTAALVVSLLLFAGSAGTATAFAPPLRLQMAPRTYLASFPAARRPAPKRARAVSPRMVILGGDTPPGAGDIHFDSYSYELDGGKPLVVGLAGGTGSGKSTMMDVILRYGDGEGRSLLAPARRCQEGARFGAHGHRHAHTCLPPRLRPSRPLLTRGQCTCVWVRVQGACAKRGGGGERGGDFEPR